MKTIFFLVLLILLPTRLFAQWQNVWTSPPLNYNLVSGWLNFEKSGNEWKNRLYTLDSLQFKIMTEGFSLTPEYIYNFNDAERLAGLQIYALQQDLNGDNKTEFYVLAYHGSSPYRQSFKILDIVSGSIIFEKNDPAYYYSYPMFADINNDGFLNCIVVRYEYPAFTNYVYEVYNTGLSGTDSPELPSSFELMQNYPNPFNPSTTIEYSLFESQTVGIAIFDMLGNKVKTLVNEFLPAGSHSVIWDGTNDAGIRQATGVYIYQMKAGNQTTVKKMIFLK